MSSQFEINEVYQPLYTTEKRYSVLTGGRGSLKSHTIHDFLVRLTYQKGQGILFTRWTLTSAHTSIIPDFENAIDRLGLRNDFHVTKTDIINKRTGSFIWFRGLKPQSGQQSSALKSIARVTTWVVEEAEELIDEAMFNKIDDSLRSKSLQNRIILVLNPAVREHWIYKRWFKDSLRQIEIDGFKVSVSSHPEIENIHSTYLIGEEYLSKDWLSKAHRWRTMAKTKYDPLLEKELTDVQYKNAVKYYVNNYLGGWLEKAEGVIFEEWSEGEFDESNTTIWYGLDYGFNPDPTAFVKVGIDWKHKKLYLHELCYKTEMSTDQIIEMVKSYTTPNDMVIADRSEKRLNNELATADIYIVKALQAPNSRRTSILEMLNFEIIVTPESNNLKEELNLYRWMDKKAGYPEDGFDHLIDGAKMVVEYYIAMHGNT